MKKPPVEEDKLETNDLLRDDLSDNGTQMIMGDINNHTDEDVRLHTQDEASYDEEEYEEGGGILTNFQEKFEQIIENEEVEDAIELNEKFLSYHLGVKMEELS